ncbi:MAG: hypothetical protein ABI036_12860 [Fibrobacteria bacterium]
MKGPWAWLKLAVLFGACLLTWTCNVSDAHKSDTLTFQVGDSLKISSGKYDSIQLELYSIRGTDTVRSKVIFHGAYKNASQLENLDLGQNLSGNFVIRLIGYRKDQIVLEVGIPFSDGKPSQSPIVYKAPDKPNEIIKNHAPTFTSGIENLSMFEGETKRIVVKANDEDGDPIQIKVKNLDSLRGLFSNSPAAIFVDTEVDSIVIAFTPGSEKGNYRFQLTVTDSHSAVEAQVFTISVGAVNRPPSVSFSGSPAGSIITGKEGLTLMVQVRARDPDSSDRLSLLSLIDPPWPRCGSGKYDTITGLLTFAPDFHCVVSGESTFANLNFRARDNGSPPETGELNASFVILDSNSAPKWKNSAADIAGKEGVVMQFDFSAQFAGDTEGDSIAFQASCGSIDGEQKKWIFVPGFHDAGKKDCEITAQDSHIPPASSKLKLKMDISDSIGVVEVKIISPIKGYISKDSLVSLQWRAGGISQTKDTTEKLKTEGANIVRRAYQDSLGNFGSDSITVYLDTKPPSNPVVSVDPATPTRNQQPQWKWTSGVGGIKVYRFGLDFEAAVLSSHESKDSVFTPSEKLPHGPHTLFVQEKDSAGNWSSSGSATAFVDTIPPNAPKMDSTPYSPLNSLQPIWTWKMGGGGAKIFRCKVDVADLSNASEQSDTTFTPSISLLEGQHTLYVQERDSAGNWSLVAKRELVLSLRGVVGQAGISDYTQIQEIALAINKNGEKFVAYKGLSPTGTGFSTQVKKFNGQFWQTLGDLSQYGTLTGSSGLAFDANNNVNICMNDSGGMATVLKFDGSIWMPLGNLRFSAGKADEIALQFAPNGTPYVVFRDRANNSRTTVMRFNGSLWETVGLPGFSIGFSYGFSISISKSNVPYIGYFDGGSSEYGLPVIQKWNENNSTWEKVGSLGVHSQNGGFFQLIRNAQDSMFFSCPISESNGDNLVFKFNGVSWESIANPISKVEEDGVALSIAFDENGKKYAAYRMNAISNKIMVKSLVGKNWITLAPNGLPKSGLLLSNLVLNPDGVPYLAFADASNEDKVSVIRYSFDP